MIDEEIVVVKLLYRADVLLERCEEHARRLGLALLADEIAAFRAELGEWANS